MNDKEMIHLTADELSFANVDERITDKKFDDKPIGYLKDAWLRFRRNRSSVVAACIILAIFLFAFLTPLINFRYDSRFLDSYYAKKGPRNLALSNVGIADGTTDRDFSERGLLRAVAIGVGAENWDGTPVTIAEGMESYYQPVRKVADPALKEDPKSGQMKELYSGKIDTYLEVGFIYRSVEQEEYRRILAWQEETGIRVLYPLIENNVYNEDPTDANFWYKSYSKDPVHVNADGSVQKLRYKGSTVLEDNYKRDADGNVVYYEYTGGGTFETAQFKIRVLYYNYYRYLNGFEPEYIFGTDSQGYDLALRMADGVRLSLLVAICVSVINLTIGVVYGAVAGYYGGATDLILERITDILAGVPFIVVATLFQIHLAAKVGAIPSLLFAFVLTGWIGTSSRVRTQFYRFKNQEYVMAARTLGARDPRIIFKHIFPNSLGTIITSSVLVIPSVIFSESMLSFLGIVKLGGADTTSLGTLLSDASSIWTNYPHLMIFPAIIISLLMISFNLFGNGLRDAFNPSLRGVEE
jgi:oligopeptide transport system permease protein